MVSRPCMLIVLLLIHVLSVISHPIVIREIIRTPENHMMAVAATTARDAMNIQNLAVTDHGN